MALKSPPKQFAADFLDYARTSHSSATVALYERTFRFLLQRISDLSLQRVSTRHIDGFIAWRASAVKPTTVNIELRALKAAFNRARRWKLIDQNPCDGVSQLRVPEQAPCYLALQDFQSLVSVMDKAWLRDIVAFAVMTGLRQGEILNLRWADVDLNRRVILVQSSPTFRTKQGRRRVIPLNESAVTMLRSRHGQVPADYAFTLNGRAIRPNWLQHAFKKAVRLAKLDDHIHFHSLRHSFASWLVQSGATLYEVQRLLGHSSPRVTEIYSHLLPEHLHKTVNRIELPLN